MKFLPKFAAVVAIILFAGSIFGQSDSRKSYTFPGTVEKVNRKSGTLTVNGEEVEGWMAAMTMQYRVDNPAVLKGIKAGTQIEATVYERDLTLHDVKVIKPVRN
jgi:Cu/Ag efflux protein CusF